jgi:hypothetical protein
MVLWVRVQKDVTSHEDHHGHFLPDVPMPGSQGWRTYVTAGLVTFTSGITVYLLLSDAARRSEIRRRKAVLSTLDNEDFSSALEQEQTRFGVLRVGGRFVNPFSE